jgi:hypothetical protein
LDVIPIKLPRQAQDNCKERLTKEVLFSESGADDHALSGDPADLRRRVFELELDGAHP